MEVSELDCFSSTQGMSFLKSVKKVNIQEKNDLIPFEATLASKGLLKTRKVSLETTILSYYI